MSRDDVKTLLKDTLRAARFTVRSGSSRQAPGAGPLTALADTVLTQAEDVLRAVSGRRPAADALASALGVLVQVADRGAGQVNGGELRWALYTLVKAILAARGVANRFVAERSLDSLVRRLPRQRVDASLLAAHVLTAFRNRQPVRLADLPADDGDDLFALNEEVAVALALAVATLLRQPPPDEAGAVVDSAIVAAEAAAGRFAGLLARPEPEPALAGLIASIAEHLP